jgi:hypothetical protein
LEPIEQTLQLDEGECVGVVRHEFGTLAPRGYGFGLEPPPGASSLSFAGAPPAGDPSVARGAPANPVSRLDQSFD